MNQYLTHEFVYHL